METSARFGAAPRTAITLVTLALLTALIGVVIAMGASPAPSSDPDGRFAYDSYGDIWTVRPDGSDPRQLTAGPEVDLSPQWSPDGSRIAFWSLAEEGADEPSAAAYYSMIESAPASLVVLDVASGGERVVASNVVVGVIGYIPIWAPDSRRIAYSHSEGSTGAVDVVDIASGEARTVLDDARSPTWAPASAGDLLAYQGGALSAELGVWVAGADGSEPHRVSRAPGSGYAFGSPAWSPDGRSLLFFAGPDGAHDIWAADASGATEASIAAEAADEYDPTWSPDGTRIAFDRVTAPAHKNLIGVVIANRDGSDALMLDSDPLFPGATMWSPDGTRVAGWLPDVESAFATHIVVLDVTNKTEPLLIPTPGNAGVSSWSRPPVSRDPAAPGSTVTNQGGAVVIVDPATGSRSPIVDVPGAP